jgi:hypothetical protein
MEVGYSIPNPDDLQTKSLEVHLRAGRKRTIWDMDRSHPEFPYSRPYDPYDPSASTNVLLRQEPEEEEDEEEDEEDDDKDDDKDDDEEEDDGYSACPCLLHEGQFDGHLVT